MGKASSKMKKQGFGDMTAVRTDAEVRLADALRAWMIVRPAAGQERFMIDAARARGFATYQPRVIRSRYNSFHRQHVVTTEAMFPGYVMVQAPEGRAWEIFSLPGVMPGKIGVLPWAFMDGFVVELRRRERDGIIDDVARQGRPRRVQKIPTVIGFVDALLEEGKPLDMNRIAVVSGMFKGAARVTCSLDQVIRH